MISISDEDARKIADAVISVMTSQPEWVTNEIRKSLPSGASVNWRYPLMPGGPCSLTLKWMVDSKARIKIEVIDQSYGASWILPIGGE